MTPSKQQQAVIDAVLYGEGNIMVKALAGTGKTSLLMMLLPYIEGDVFLGAFNVPIKDELIRRVGEMRLPNCRCDIKTIHGAGMGAYIYGGGDRQAKTEKNKVYFLIDELAAHDDVYSTYQNFLVKLVGFAKRAGIGPLVPDTRAEWMKLIDYYSVDDEIPSSTGYGMESEEADDELLENLIAYAHNLYEMSLERCRRYVVDGERSNGWIDFDDMLLAPIHYNCNFKKYDWVFCDEVQDNSAIRQEITIRMVKPKTGRMVAVGDENQAIYGFTGANHNVMDDLRNRMNMEVYPLSVTYRCPKVVVALANTWVPALEAHPTAPEGVRRTVYLEPAPCPYCAGTGFTQDVPECVTIQCTACNGKGKTGADFWGEAPTLGPDDVILCRNNRPVVDLAYQLLRKGIACKIEGRDFATSLTKLCQRWKVKELNALENKLRDFREKEAAKWRLKNNEERATGVEDKVDTLMTLLFAVRESGKSRVTDLVDRIDMMFAAKDGEKPRVLTLSSVHKWKGRESKRVYILGRARYMPSKWARQDWEIRGENNLLYVAVTRSMSELIDVIVPDITAKPRNTGGY